MYYKNAASNQTILEAFLLSVVHHCKRAWEPPLLVEKNSITYRGTVLHSRDSIFRDVRLAPPVCPIPRSGSIHVGLFQSLPYCRSC